MCDKVMETHINRFSCFIFMLDGAPAASQGLSVPLSLPWIKSVVYRVVYKDFLQWSFISTWN